MPKSRPKKTEQVAVKPAPRAIPQAAGRPGLVWTDEVVSKICKAIQGSVPLDDAARLAGVCATAFFDRKRAGRKAIEKEKTGAELTEHEQACLKFTKRLDEASSQAVLINIAPISKAAQTGDWKASAWLLERRQPNKFGPRVRVHVEAELKDTYDRVKKAFADDPTTLERVVRAIAGDDLADEPGEDE